MMYPSTHFAAVETPLVKFDRALLAWLSRAGGQADVAHAAGGLKTFRVDRVPVMWQRVHGEATPPSEFTVRHLNKREGDETELDLLRALRAPPAWLNVYTQRDRLIFWRVYDTRILGTALRTLAAVRARVPRDGEGEGFRVYSSEAVTHCESFSQGELDRFLYTALPPEDLVYIRVNPRGVDKTTTGNGMRIAAGGGAK